MNNIIDNKSEIILPQAIDSEKAVLGAILKEKDVFVEILDILKPCSFFKEAHQTIFKAMIRLYWCDIPIDLLSLTEELNKEGELKSVGDYSYIAQLSQILYSTTNVKFYANNVSQKYILRELISLSNTIKAEACEESANVDDLINFTEIQLFEINNENIKTETKEINVIIKDILNNIKELRERKTDLLGISSGFPKIDEITFGWQESQLIVIAGMIGMGKTSFALSMASKMAIEQKVSVGIFSLKMSSEQLVSRLIISDSGISQKKFIDEKLDDTEQKQLDSSISKLNNASIFIDETPSISTLVIKSKARRLKMHHDVNVIIIDYLQIIKCSNTKYKDKEDEISQIIHNLKAIAIELRIPIIILSQLNNSVDFRGGDKRPILSDLMLSNGTIEQVADIVCFIHRPEYYGFIEDENGKSLKGFAELIIAKNLNGRIGDIPLRFNEDSALFNDI